MKPFTCSSRASSSSSGAARRPFRQHGTGGTLGSLSLSLSAYTFASLLSAFLKAKTLPCRLPPPLFRATRSDGGSANTSTLRSAEEAWAAKEAFGGRDCPFADRPAVVAFVKATPEFQALQAAHGRGDTAGKRQASRALMLAFHPDKFHALYRACDKDLSYDAWTEIATYR